MWAIDRAFRSTIDAILFLDALRKGGVEFRSLTQCIDTTTPEGRKWFIDTASWAEYERAIISRRTKEKMAAARRRGMRLGRPPLLTEDQIAQARALLKDPAQTYRSVGELFGVHHSTLCRAVRRRPDQLVTP